jgi:uncharacterized membrane protein YfbV (UPF0208 family)
VDLGEIFPIVVKLTAEDALKILAGAGSAVALAFTGGFYLKKAMQGSALLDSRAQTDLANQRAESYKEELAKVKAALDRANEKLTDLTGENQKARADLQILANSPHSSGAIAPQLKQMTTFRPA